MTDLPPAASSAAEDSGARELDLTTCDREPIHQLNRVQPFGCLIAVTHDWIVSQASQNLEHFAGISAAEAVGEPLAALLENRSLHDIRNRLQFLRGGEGSERVRNIVFRHSDAGYGATVHMSGQYIVLEFEPSVPASEYEDDISTVRSILARLSESEDVGKFCRESAKFLQLLTGLDRVMVYRFLPDGSGEVFAEAKKPALEPFLNLRYPASDIPKQARELYLRNPIRIIADSSERGVEIYPAQSPDGGLLDLSQSVLRSVSPVHLEYLANMGVAGSMSISIIVNGKLWGLFACHHGETIRLSASKKGAAELFGQMFSLLLSAKLTEQETRTSNEVRKLTDAFTASMNMQNTPLEELLPMLREVSQFLAADGFGVVLNGSTHIEGSGPGEAEFAQMVKFLNRASANKVYSTHKLGGAMPGAADFAADAAGILAIPISRSPRDYIVFFRREVVKSVSWAGNPDKPVTPQNGTPRLSPRKSFEAWRTMVEGECEYWSAADLATAAQLRMTLLEIVLRLTGEAEKHRAASEERQELLIAELNHRVRNILGLVSGLISQTKSKSHSAADFVAVLDSRVQALARAHDQITRQNWSAAPLFDMVRTELESYGGSQPGRVVFDGDDCLLEPAAYSAAALVVHELATNAAKYGALSSQGGRVTLGARKLPDGSLSLTWQERGGPPVKAPSRRGFGTTIVERLIPHELRGTADVRYRLGGLEAEFQLPASYVQPAPPDTLAALTPSKTPVESGWCPGSVLIVEDNLVIGMGAEAIFEGIGAEDIDLVSSLAEAEAALAAKLYDFVFLDINLGDTTTLGLAQDLYDSGRKFAFASGYSDRLDTPGPLAQVPRVSKPYGKDSVLLALAAVAPAG
ncbi:HWE histidine kinase domain-containing protein [Cribrihabitans neustonicus]|uniref:HWE histidine kinase domain-containing protein n=1 Tax=Cribrihabitans neustonicus TaxID=1429085 RepID=UPI003B5CB992